MGFHSFACALKQSILSLCSLCFKYAWYSLS